MRHKSLEELELEAAVDEVEHRGASGVEGEPAAPLRSYMVGFTILAALGLANHWGFAEFSETTYLKWYLSNGALIGFATSVAATTWGDINKNTELISAHPLRYLAACAWLVGLPLFSLGTHLRRGQEAGRSASPLDLLLTVPFVFAIMGLLLVWAAVVVPLQYVIYLICGAPARLGLKSAWLPVARIHRSGRLVVEEIPVGSGVPKGWWDASLFSRPVSITGLLFSLVFFLLKPFLM